MIRRILLVLFLSASVPIYLFSQANSSHILSMEVVNFISAEISDIDAILNDVIKNNSFTQFNYQFCNNPIGSFSFEFGLEHRAAYWPDISFGSNEYDFHLYQEYRLFPFKKAPSGFFVGPMLHFLLHFSVDAPEQNIYYTGLGVSIGYQFLLQKWAFSITTGASGGLLFPSGQLTWLGLPNLVGIHIGRVL
jgi:hypothetical protein